MRRRSALLSSIALLAPVALTAVPQAGAAAAPLGATSAPQGYAAQVVRDWERHTMQVVYDPTMGASAIPLGVPRLGYSSMGCTGL